MSSEFQLAQLGNGVRLAYAEQGDADGLPVVLLHGISDSHHSYDLVRPLLPRAWRVFALTLRGHGASDKPEAAYDMPAFAADVAAFMDTMAIDRAVIVGHSMSSAVALQIAAHYPERVAGLVLIGAFAAFRGEPGIEELEAAVAAFDNAADPEFARAFQESTLANPIPAEFLDLAVSETLRMPAHAWRGAVKGLEDFDPCAAAAQCRAPAAIIWGEKDAYCPRAHQLTLRDTLRSSRLFTLANVGHAVHWERPADVAALLRAFVGELQDAAKMSEDFAA